jgi:hypothetical protein
MWEVLETAKNVAEKSHLISIDERALVHFSGKLLEEGIEIPPWECRYHFFDGGENTVAYLLVLDSINFCFWPEPGHTQWEIEYESTRLSGYFALAASLKRAVESGVPITEAGYLAVLSSDQLNRILSGRGQLQLLDNRLRILNSLGKVILEDYGGKAGMLVETAGNSAIKLVRLLTEKLPSFRDSGKYLDRDVFFYKRAQIFAADLYGAFDGKDWGSFIDMEKLTAFADYKLPQLLRHLGIFRYSPALAQKVDRQVFIEAGSFEEIEIRANTIWAVELIRRELNKQGEDLRSFEIDWILWNRSQDMSLNVKPYHRTVTVFY